MKNLLLLITILLSVIANGQIKELELDLAKLEPDKKQEIQIISAEYSGIRLKNKLVSASYDVKYELQELRYEGFDTGGLNSSTGTSCNDLKNLIKKLKVKEPTDKKHHEKEIPETIKEVNRILKKGDCKDDEELEDAAKLIDQTSNTIDFPQNIIITSGLQFYITIKRNDGLTWIIYVKTSQRGNWKTLYGFTYVPEIFSKNQTYHTRSVAGSDPAMYTVIEDRSTRDFLTNITPTIMFTWTPSKVADKGYKKIFNNNVYKFGVVGGIALDLEKPTAMIGPTIVFADNLSISSGLIFTERSRLKSKYSSGDEVGEELDFDQLHDTGLSTYKPELFFSISFRFNENPFSKKGDDSEE